MALPMSCIAFLLFSMLPVHIICGEDAHAHSVKVYKKYWYLTRMGESIMIDPWSYIDWFSEPKIFSFSHNVFYPIKNKSDRTKTNSCIVCKPVEFGPV